MESQKFEKPHVLNVRNYVVAEEPKDENSNERISDQTFTGNFTIDEDGNRVTSDANCVDNCDNHVANTGNCITTESQKSTYISYPSRWWLLVSVLLVTVANYAHRLSFAAVR